MIKDGSPPISWLTGAPSEKRWLLVFDNADELRLLLHSLPNKGRGSILITTRNKHLDKDLPENTIPFHLVGLAEQEGEDFLWSRVRSISTGNGDKALCRKLAIHFDCWPLVLRQLGAFMIHCPIAPKDMWERVQHTRRASVDEQIYAYNGNADYPEGTLMKAWEHILSTLPPHSSRLLNLLSLLDPEQIPADLFPRPNISKTESFQFLSHEFRYLDARADLMRYELIAKNDDIISIHRVVQSTRIKMITPTERNEAFDMALSTLRACFPCQVLGNHMYDVWDECGKYLPHVLAFSRAEQEWRPKLNSYTDYINMMCDCTWYVTTASSTCKTKPADTQRRCQVHVGNWPTQ